jgi:alkanesulfonate monooxygenase SsuD/methylene tetrahydromethanopterin reductase-like flavin-dependent oxidoreductase (luciferase family)
MAVTFGLWGLPEDVYDISSGATLLDGYVRSIDLLGPEFTTLWASDHFQFGDAPVFECWTRMCFLAARFERFHIGSIVLGQGYRNPALLAKMAATFQFLSGGRLVLGIGAGWHHEEYRSYGFEYPSRKERVDQLVEALTILHLLWEGGPATFHGEHYSITDAYCLPIPPTPIPIMIGSAGRRVVRIAAEHGDGWNCDSSPAVFDPPHARLVDRLHELGRSADKITISVSAQVNFPEDVDTFVGVVPTEFPDYDFDQVIHGPTPQDAIASLHYFVEQGVTHFQIAPQDLRTLRLFATEVAPALAEEATRRRDSS